MFLKITMNTSKKSNAEKVISYTKHAEDRMIDRGISQQEVEAALLHPIKEKPAQNGRRESQSLVVRSGRRKLLRVVSEGELNILVITVIATSKLEKYGVSE